MRRFCWCFYFPLVMVAGCNLMTMPDNDVAPKPPDAAVFSEQDYWDQLAANVQADVFNSSDELCLAADKLVKTGQLKDVSRLADIRKTRTEPISGDAKTSIVSVLKGK